MQTAFLFSRMSLAEELLLAQENNPINQELAGSHQ
jgi:hypothetical protein